jgi:hypothetical protein
MVDSWHVEDELERFEHRACPGRFDLQQLPVGDRVTVDAPVGRARVVADEERVGEWTLADDAPPDQRLRL